MRVNYYIWSGVYRPTFKLFNRRRSPALHYFPTVVVDVNLNDWAIPLSVHWGGPLLGKPGLTFRIGPVNIGWSRL